MKLILNERRLHNIFSLIPQLFPSAQESVKILLNILFGVFVEMKVPNYVVLANILKEHSLMFGAINPNSQVETICVLVNLTELDGGICFCFQLENKKQKPLNKLSLQLKSNTNITRSS